MKSAEQVLSEIALDRIVMQDTKSDGAYTHVMTMAQFTYMAKKLWISIEVAPGVKHGFPKRPTKKQAKVAFVAMTTGSQKIFSARDLVGCESVGELRNLIQKKLADARGGI